MAAECVQISNSTQCPAFGTFLVSTDSTLAGLYPFLKFVTNTASFDTQLSSYLNSSYVEEKYQTLFGCRNILLSDTTDLYARYTTSVVCNGIIQNSRDPCNLSVDESRPICADACAQQALSESTITSNSNLCLNPSNYTDTQIRADFTNCALPASSLQNVACIQGSDNEPGNCGFQANIVGLCTYCAQNSKDDACCSASNSDTRCADVAIPSVVNSFSLKMPTSTATATSGSGSSTISAPGSASNTNDAATSNSTPSSLPLSQKASHGSNNLSGGAIGAIVVGSVLGLALLTLLILFILCVCRRRQKQKRKIKKPPVLASVVEYKKSESISSTPPESPILRGPNNTDYIILPGGRIARKSANYGQSLAPNSVSKPTFSPFIAAKSCEKNSSNCPKSTSAVAGAYSTPGAMHGAGSKSTSSARYSTPGVTSTTSALSDPCSHSLLSVSQRGNENNEYEVLPGGRRVRKAVPNNHHHNHLSPNNISAMAGAGTAALASAAPSGKGNEFHNSGLVGKTRQRGMSIASRISRISSRITPATLLSRAEHIQAPPPTSSDIHVPSESETERTSSAPPASSCRDEYSEDILKAGSLVAAVWSYQPQTLDEYALERGDMLEVVGLWNDGWATGRLSRDRVDYWEEKMKKLKEGNGISGNGGDGLEMNLVQTDTVKAFPLVCVCSAKRWREVVQKHS